jgi:hypothetical protein
VRVPLAGAVDDPREDRPVHPGRASERLTQARVALAVVRSLERLARFAKAVREARQRVMCNTRSDLQTRLLARRTGAQPPGRTGHTVNLAQAGWGA